MDLGALLIFFQTQFGDHVAFETRHISRRQPIQREDHDILPAQVSAAGTEAGMMRPQGLERLAHVLFHQVLDHSTARVGRSSVPVNVEPVVPLSCT